jgi:hypothetical protein
MKSIVVALAVLAGAGCTDASDEEKLIALAVDNLPPPGSLASPAEGFASYDSSIDSSGSCGGDVMRPGPQAVSSYLANFAIVANTYATCGGFHARGQALDVWISGHAAKQTFADWLTANNSEMARRLGLVQVIWNHQMWRSYDGGPGKPQGGWGNYFGDNPHTDHLHLSFGEAGAQGITSFFTDVIGAHAASGGFAFQANTHELWIDAAPTGLGMMAATSPSLARVGGGSAVAFQANTGELFVVGSAGTGPTGFGMMAGTSPSITALGGGYEVAFQANTGELWAAGSAGTGPTGLGMAAGTSPSITELGGGYAIAFQANTGTLWLAGAAGTADQQLGMMAGTSPSITALAHGGYEIAFQANTGELWVAGSANTGPSGLGMMAGTSPSITALADGGYQVAFQANSGELWVAGSAGTAPTGLGMMAGTSPSITARGAGYEVLFQANTGELYRAGSGGAASLGFGMAAGSSPTN